MKKGAGRLMESPFAFPLFAEVILLNARTAGVGAAMCCPRLSFSSSWSRLRGCDSADRGAEGGMAPGGGCRAGDGF
jgi:hypothetical protein